MDKPKPGPGRVLVKAHVVGVNFADTLLRRGTYIVQPNLPETPGYEAAGIVEEVGQGVEPRSRPFKLIELLVPSFDAFRANAGKTTHRRYGRAYAIVEACNSPYLSSISLASSRSL